MVRPNAMARLLPAITAGLIGGLLTLSAALAYPAVVFNGPLAPYLGTGITLALFTSMVLGAIVAWQSSYPAAIAQAQIETAVVLGSIATVITEVAAAEAQLGTVLVVIAIASITLGVIFVLLGAFRLGNAVRYIPFPVIGGFLGYIAWLLAKGGMATLIGRPLAIDVMPDLVAPAMLLHWLPAALLAAALLILQARRRHYLNVPAVLVTALAAFWLVAWLSGADLASLLAGGYVLEPLPLGQGWSPMRLPAAMEAVDWGVVVTVLPNILVVSLVALITLLVTASTLEVASRRPVDLDRELIVTGVGNLAAALGGGLPGYHSVSASLLPSYMGTRSRLVGLIGAAMCAATLLFGGPLLAFVPKLLIGLVLLYLAFDIAAELIVERWPMLRLGERAVLLLVLVTLIGVGFMEGIVLGVVAGLADFAIKYARTDVVRGQGNGLVYASNVLRPSAQTAWLEATAEAIHVVRLQGFLFFGTAHRLIEEIGGQLAGPRTVPLRFLVLDFSRVTGADSSAIASFVRLMAAAESRAFQVLLSAVPETVAGLISTAPGSSAALIFADLDHGLEHAEDALLQAAAPAVADEEQQASLEFGHVLDDPAMRRRFRSYALPVTWQAGDLVMGQGERSTAMYFIETGQLTASLALADGGIVRLRTLLPGTVVGEVGCYLDVPRTLTLVAESAVSAWAIDRDGLERMRREAPDLAADFHLGLVRVTVARLAALTRYLEHHDR